jgi:hypothetical protein
MTLLAAGTLALLAGCKGNTTSAAFPEHQVPEPPSVTAYPASAADPFTADPLSSDLWHGTHWYSLTSPANTARTTAPAKAALLFDASTLYVAFVCEKQAVAPASVRDVVSLYLDTTGEADTTEMVKIAVDAQGQATCAWVRSAMPAPRRQDGSPDLGHPVSTIPNQPVPNLKARVNESTLSADGSGGGAVWTAVVAVPLRNLPLPLRTSAHPGDHWKLNLLRTVTGERGDVLQANLSPVYVGAQEWTPYRLADVVLSQ